RGWGWDRSPPCGHATNATPSRVITNPRRSPAAFPILEDRPRGRQASADALYSTRHLKRIQPNRLVYMTRKHFEAIAHCLRTNRPLAHGEHYEVEAEVFLRIVVEISRACKRFNPRFDSYRFECASGLHSSEL